MVQHEQQKVDLQNNTIDNGNETNFEVTLTKVGGANPNASESKKKHSPLYFMLVLQIN